MQFTVSCPCGSDVSQSAANETELDSYTSCPDCGRQYIVTVTAMEVG